MWSVLMGDNVQQFKNLCIVILSASWNEFSYLTTFIS